MYITSRVSAGLPVNALHHTEEDTVFASLFPKSQ